MAVPAIPELAEQLSPLILPALSSLLEGAKTVGEVITAIGQKAGELQWEVIFGVWDRLRPRLESQPETRQRLEEVSQKADDPRAVSLLSWELEKLLAALKPDELVEIHNLVNQTRTEKRVTIARGDRSVAIGGDASSTTIITGDDNLIEQ